MRDVRRPLGVAHWVSWTGLGPTEAWPHRGKKNLSCANMAVTIGAAGKGAAFPEPPGAPSVPTARERLPPSSS